MNEFIVWDGNRNKFTEQMFIDQIFINMNGEIVWWSHSGRETLDFNYTAFQYIGKTDINNKKIYDGSSVFEFGYYAGEVVHIGYFYYDKDELSYKIKVLSSIFKNGQSNKFEGQSFLFDSGMINFKIIDTIQENKLGLIK